MAYKEVSEATNMPEHAWQRWGWIWTFLFYMILSLTTLLWFLSSNRVDDIAIPVLLAVTAGLHPLFHYFLTSRRSHIRDSNLLGVLYVFLLTSTIFALVQIHPVFFFLLAGYFGQIFYTLPSRQAIPIALLATALFAGASLNSGNLLALIRNPIFWMWLVGGMAASLMALWIEAIVRQSHQRQEFIQQLTETRSELARAEREAGILSERERLSREIHDTLAQGFISIVTHLEAADGALENRPIDSIDLERLTHHLDRARETARDNLHEARRVVQDLRPDLLEGAALPRAVERLATRWAQSSQIQIGTSVHGLVETLPIEVEVSLLRVVQEGLTNVARHAQATRADVTLSYLPEELILDVQDNGAGLSQEELRGESGGFGLRSMRERVESMGGSMEIESDEEGTTLIFRVPFRQEAEMGETEDILA